MLLGVCLQFKYGWATPSSQAKNHCYFTFRREKAAKSNGEQLFCSKTKNIHFPKMLSVFGFWYLVVPYGYWRWTLLHSRILEKTTWTICWAYFTHIQSVQMRALWRDCMGTFISIFYLVRSISYLGQKKLLLFSLPFSHWLSLILNKMSVLSVSILKPPQYKL